MWTITASGAQSRYVKTLVCFIDQSKIFVILAHLFRAGKLFVSQFFCCVKKGWCHGSKFDFSIQEEVCDNLLLQADLDSCVERATTQSDSKTTDSNERRKRIPSHLIVPCIYIYIYVSNFKGICCFFFIKFLFCSLITFILEWFYLDFFKLFLPKMLSPVMSRLYFQYNLFPLDP